MVWPFRRRKTGRHRLVSPQVGVVLPGVALASHAVADVPVDVPDVIEAVVPDVVEPARLSVPSPRTADEPDIMPLPARVVLFFEDGSRQVVTPLSEVSERMARAADRLIGPEPARPAASG